MKSFVNNNYTSPTGDPFADVGGLVIEYLFEKKPDKSIIDLIEEVTNIYVNHWDNNLHTFFLNSTITHNSCKGEKGIQKTLNYYKGLFDEDAGVNGFCRITGQKGKVFSAGRDNHIMSGSATLINFHHGFESGIFLSKEALIRVFFVPLGIQLLGDKNALLTSNNEAVTRFFVRKNVDDNIRDLASGISKSVQKSDFNNPVNALFDYALQCLENIKTITYDAESGTSKLTGTALNLYHFTNFSASVTINLHTLPAIIFNFYGYCILKHKKQWQNFIFRYYSNSKFKNGSFDEHSDVWKNNKEEFGYQSFRIWKNIIFENLINDKSILKYFLQHSKTHQLNFNIIEIYQINIQNMDKKTLIKIKEISDFIVNGRSDDEIKKSMTLLNKAKSNHELRYFLLKLAGKNYLEGNEKPLFSLEEYVEYLFPDGVSWREIRDLLLIAIYQKLHETNKAFEIELLENELVNQLNEN